ncbi:FtsX-like permease family protein [Candidatus Saccharibacteria bacterium]|nr:FtsX-like permease family protein [Candidatus Saccharibacteria bacterium]
MISLKNAVILANTKLRSKRVLLYLSILISSILFAVLICGILVFTGAEKSAVTFVNKANDGAYRVEVSPVLPASIYSYEFPLSIESIRSIRSIEAIYYKEQEAKYKSLGLKYDKSLEVSALKPSVYFDPSTPDEQRFEIVPNSPIVQYDQNLRYSNYIKTAKNKISDLKEIASKYGGKGFYSTEQTGALGIPNLKVLKAGKEDFKDDEMKTSDPSTYGYATSAIHNGYYLLQNQTLLSRYLLSPPINPSAIPVVVTAQEAASLFGKEKSIGQEPKDDKAKGQWLQQIQNKFANYTYQACYRNSTEINMLNKIERDYAEAINNKANKEYIAPSLQYALPTQVCGDIVISKDIRSPDEKKSDALTLNSEKKLGTYIEPQHRLLTFEIVGIYSARPYSLYTDNVQSYLQNLLSVESNSSSSNSIIKEGYEKLPRSAQFPIDSTPLLLENQLAKDAGLVTHVIDFQTIEQAQAFLKEETCPNYETGCVKLFTGSPYGSNYLILSEIGKTFQKLMTYTLPIVLGLAAIIVWFTMVRVMSENRKETAVYRAMGAKRRDIVAVYVIYSLILAFRIAVLSVLLGVIAALVIDNTYGSQLTAIATTGFGNVTTDLKFSLFNVHSPYLFAVIGSIFGITLLAVIQPLHRNVRRSPIEDMRSE